MKNYKRPESVQKAIDRSENLASDLLESSGLAEQGLSLKTLTSLINSGSTSGGAGTRPVGQFAVRQPSYLTSLWLIFCVVTLGLDQPFD